MELNSPSRCKNVSCSLPHLSRDLYSIYFEKYASKFQFGQMITSDTFSKISDASLFFLPFSLKFRACKREMSQLIPLLFALQPLSVPVEPKRSESRRMTDASRLNKTNRRQEVAVVNGVTCSRVVPIDHVEE